MVVAEMVMERIARTLGRPVEEIKRLNMYKVRGCERCDEWGV